MKINPFERAEVTLKYRRNTTRARIRNLWLRFQLRSLLYVSEIPLKSFPSGFGGFLNNLDARAGTRVMATSRDAPRAYVMVSAISLKSCLVRPSTNTMGANTQTVVRVDEMIAAPTSFAPATAARLGSIPARLSLKMFSITTMELSTSIPTATARPESDIRLMVTPEKYMSTMAKVKLMGMLRRVMNVGLKSLKKRRSTIMAKRAPYIRLSKIACMIR